MEIDIIVGGKKRMYGQTKNNTPLTINQLCFCDSVEQAQFGKLNIMGMLPSRKIYLNEVPYIFNTTLLLDYFLEPGEYHNEIFLKIEDKNAVQYESPILVLEDKYDVTYRGIAWFPMNIILDTYKPITIKLLFDNHEVLFSETFTFSQGESPNILINLTEDRLDTSGLLTPDGVNTDIPQILAKRAHRSLIVIDQYLTGEYLEKLVSHTHQNTTIMALGGEQKRATFSSLNMSNFTNEISIRFSPKHVLERFHDRFIIINNTEIYHLGYSLKDLDKQISRYSKINGTDEAQKIISTFNTIWQAAIPL